MVKINIPQDIILVDDDNNVLLDPNGKPVSISFKKFVGSTLLTDQKYGKTMDDILSAVDVKARLAVAVDSVELEREDWEKLCAVMKEPSSGYVPAIATQLSSFFLAIKNAK